MISSSFFVHEEVCNNYHIFTAPVSDTRDLEAAQAYLEHAAQQNLVSVEIEIYVLLRNSKNGG